MSEIYLNKGNTCSVTVVIPTLGGESLKGTIEQINHGTIVPSEILICIPNEYASRVEGILFENIKIIKTNCRGQVAQRAIGFQTATNPLVLQLDDDVCLDELCLETLVECMGTKENISISPSLLDEKTGEPSRYMTKPTKQSSLLYKLLFVIINGKQGYQPGKISKAGVNMAYSRTEFNAYEVDWLPGGCAIHSQQNLIKHNFYPFNSKAYAEDLFHSALLKHAGIKLYHCPKAICRLDNSSSKGHGVRSLFRIFYSASRALFHYAYITKKNRLRLFVFLGLYYLAFLPVNRLIFKYKAH